MTTPDQDCNSCGQPMSEHIGEEKVCPWPKTEHPRPECQWIGTDYNEWRGEWAWLVQCKGDNYRDLHDPRHFTYCPHCGGKMKEPLTSTSK
jgi:hypothetical protein